MLTGKHFVNGQWIESGWSFHDKINPSTEDVVGTFSYASTPTVLDAVKAAQVAFKSWKNTSRVKRADLFFKLSQLVERDQDILAAIISKETGKNLNEAKAEVIESLHMCQWVAAQGRQPCGDWMASEIASKDAYIIRKPKGVVAVISPWNFPLAIGSFWTTGPALVEGNTVVHKPSELTPFTAQYAAKLYQEAGFPDGVYNVVHGDGLTGSCLAESDGIKSILFTGSAKVGRILRAICAERYDRNCSTETGSKSATILFEDGNQELALEVMLASAFKLSGQRCVSSGRMLIQESIYDAFCERFVTETLLRVVVGDPFEDPAPYCGPLISNEHRANVEIFNYETRKHDDVEILIDGRRTIGPGYFLTPHVYKTTWETKGLQYPHKRYFLAEEVFGPHVALIPFRDMDDAIRIYNDTDYGLAVGVITDDFRRMRKMREECNAGMIYFNGGSIAAESHFPFTGLNKSGSGFGSAAATYMNVTDQMSVTINYDNHITWAQGMK